MIWRDSSFAVVLLVVNFALFGFATHNRFATAGESRAIVAGLSHWTAGDFGLSDASPPLTRMVAVLPVLTLRPVVRGLQSRDECVNPDVWSRFEDRIARDFAGSMLADDYLTIIRIAKLAGYFWWLLGAWMVFLWSRELYGKEAAWLALTLWSLAPNVLAAEATIDSALPAAVSSIALSYAFMRSIRRHDLPDALGIGLLLGFAMLIDYLPTFLVVVGFIPWKIYQLRHTRRECRVADVLAGLGRAALLLGVCLWVINLGYGMLPNWQRLKDYVFVSQALGGTSPSRSIFQERVDSGNRFRERFFGNMIVPIPIDYLRGIDRRLWEGESNVTSRPNEIKNDPSNIAASIVARLPIGMWAMMMWATGLTALSRKSDESLPSDLLLWVWVGLILAAVEFHPRLFSIDRGIVLATPFAIVGVSRLGRNLTLRRWRAGAVVFLLASWTLISSLVGNWCGRPYVNEIFGGSNNFQAQLTYGPGDGGSDLLLLKDWVDRHPEASSLGIAVRHAVDLKPFGLAEDIASLGAKAALGNRLSRERRLGLSPGYYALDVNALRSKMYSHFRTLQPVTRIGSAIAVYFLTKDMAERIRHNLGLPSLNTPTPAPGAGRGFVHRIYTDEFGDKSHYTVFVPYAYTGDRSYPLILFLHGGGDAGMEGDQYLKVGLPPAIEAREDSFDFITVIPQGRTGNWLPDSWGAKRALDILERVQADYLVDRKRIYLTGLSSGGTGVWALAERYPDRWAAIVPVSTASCEPSAALRMKDVPCWCFHNVNDVGSPPDGPRAMIAAIRRAGGKPNYSEFFCPVTTQDERHNAWDAAYQNPELYNWLLGHSLP